MIPYSLENDYLSSNCVLFVGAGISSRVKRKDGINVPHWNEFVNQHNQEFKYHFLDLR